MNDAELIAKQARYIEELKEENESLKSVIRAVHIELIRVGGPLNDNYHGYTKEQLEIFFRIETLVTGREIATEI